MAATVSSERDTVATPVQRAFREALYAGAISLGLFVLSLSAVAVGQDKSVKPGINDPFKNPDVKGYQGKFEVESREVYANREKIVAAYGAIAAQENALVERLLTYLRGRNDCRIIGHSANRDGTRIPTISFVFDGRDSAEICKAMDAHRIAIRFGDFHSRRLAEYLDLTENNGMVRVSMVHYNTIEEIDRMTKALDTILGSTAGSATAA